MPVCTETHRAPSVTRSAGTAAASTSAGRPDGRRNRLRRSARPGCSRRGGDGPAGSPVAQDVELRLPGDRHGPAPRGPANAAPSSRSGRATHRRRSPELGRRLVYAHLESAPPQRVCRRQAADSAADDGDPGRSRHRLAQFWPKSRSPTSKRHRARHRAPDGSLIRVGTGGRMTSATRTPRVTERTGRTSQWAGAGWVWRQARHHTADRLHRTAPSQSAAAALSTARVRAARPARTIITMRPGPAPKA